MFEIQPKQVYAARSGLEGYGLRVHHKHPHWGPLVAFLKIFRIDVPERRLRTEFLINWAYKDKRRYLQGAPYASLAAKVNGVDVIGHLTRFVGVEFGYPARDFQELKDSWDGISQEKRYALATQLAAAVDALEQQRMVHGDLNPNNLLVAGGPDEALLCYLTDFDGFTHPAAPQLPRKFNGDFVRPLGSEGYQHRTLLTRLDQDANGESEIAVETDRFALAVLIPELVTWSNATTEHLKRTELLASSNIRNKSLADLPAYLRDRFPPGFELLKAALEAESPDKMPSPQQWISVLSKPMPVSAREVQAAPQRDASVAGRKEHIFISYSKRSRDSAEALARYLESNGYAVWWDTELVSGDAYSDVIISELNAARAVIVIWTPASVKSDWVRSEARRAHAQKKFIQVMAPGLTIDDIPPPYDQYHLEPLENRTAIQRALERLDVPRRSMAS